MSNRLGRLGVFGTGRSSAILDICHVTGWLFSFCESVHQRMNTWELIFGTTFESFEDSLESCQLRDWIWQTWWALMLVCVQFIYPRLPTSTGKETLHILPVCSCLLSVFPNFSEDKLSVAWSVQWLSRIVLVCKDHSVDRVSNCLCKFCTMPNSVVWSLLGSQSLTYLACW